MIACEIDERLSAVSDTTIMLNFSKALTALYPYMKAICAHCYDAYDDIVEPLYHAMVFFTFAGKYGVCTPVESCHKYEFVSCNYEQLMHVRVSPKNVPFVAKSIDGSFEITEAFLRNNILIFHGFGDGEHALSACVSLGDSDDVSFDLTAVEVYDPIAAVKATRPQILWLPNDAVKYEFFFKVKSKENAT